MFSVAEKRKIAATVEAVLRSLGHPEMPKDHIKFRLHVDGTESWSWADIEPNWVHDEQAAQGKASEPNPWNEYARELMK